MKKKLIIVGISLIVLLLGLGISKYYFDSINTPPAEEDILLVKGAPQKGSNTPKVELVEFLDPQCESCRAFYPIVDKIIKKYPNKVRLTIRYIPFHQYSELAIKILEASRLQNKFWATLEVIFKYQPYWGGHHAARPDLLWKYLPEAGLDIDRLKVDIQKPEWLTIIQRDKEHAQKLQIRATPSFFVNGKKLKTFGEIQLNDLVDSELGLK